MKKTMMMMMKKKMTKKTKIMKKNEDEDEFKESTPSEVFEYMFIPYKGYSGLFSVSIATSFDWLQY